jgi:anthranilate phosphoribosyltransferase
VSEPGVSLAELGGWPAVLGPLMAGTDLTSVQAAAAMTDILDGGATPAQVAAVITALRMKGETASEMHGLVQAMRSRARPVPVPADLRDSLIDTCGTGGDGSGSVNVSTLAALVVAGAGGKVAKHGNRAASSTSGSADLLEALGVALDPGPDVVVRCIEQAGIGFLFAPAYHPAMRHAGPVRLELGVPTVFNYLGPLANPAGVRRQVVGVSSPAMAERMLAVLRAQGAVRALVVHGHDGLDELTTTTTSTVYDLEGGEVRTYAVDPGSVGLTPSSRAQLALPAGAAVDVARRVIDGEPSPHADLVVLNAAAGIVVAGLAPDLAKGVEMARASLSGGKAAQALDRLVAASQHSA